MSDLAERLKAAAVAAIEDVAPAMLADPGELGLLTIELEISGGGTKITGGRAWIERSANLRAAIAGSAGAGGGRAEG